METWAVPKSKSQLQVEQALIEVLADAWIFGQEFDDAMQDIMEEHATTRVPIDHGTEVIYHRFNSLVADNWDFCKEIYTKTGIAKATMGRPF